MMHDLMAAQSKTKKATVSQWCRVLGVSRSGWYAARQRQQCTRQSSMLSIQAKAAFDASGQSCLSAALKAQDLVVGRHRAPMLMRGNELRALAAQIRAHHGQPSHAASGCQPAGAPVQPPGTQPGLGDGAEHVGTAGMRGLEHGHHQPPARPRTIGSFRPWRPICQSSSLGRVGATRADWQHESQRQLLG